MIVLLHNETDCGLNRRFLELGESERGVTPISKGLRGKTVNNLQNETPWRNNSDKTLQSAMLTLPLEACLFGLVVPEQSKKKKKKVEKDSL